MINPFTACVKHRTALIFETGFLGGQHLRAMRAAKGRKEEKLFDGAPSTFGCLPFPEVDLTGFALGVTEIGVMLVQQ